LCIAFEVPESHELASDPEYVLKVLGKSDLTSDQYGRQNFLRCSADFVYQFGVRYDDQPILYSRDFEEAVWPLPPVTNREVQLSCTKD
jgi:hypothetical protein